MPQVRGLATLNPVVRRLSPLTNSLQLTPWPELSLWPLRYNHQLLISSTALGQSRQWDSKSLSPQTRCLLCASATLIAFRTASPIYPARDCYSGSRRSLYPIRADLARQSTDPRTHLSNFRLYWIVKGSGACSSGSRLVDTGGMVAQRITAAGLAAPSTSISAPDFTS